MVRTNGKEFLGFECTPAIYEAVQREAFRKRKTVSDVLRDIVTEHVISSNTSVLKELENDDKEAQP